MAKYSVAVEIWRFQLDRIYPGIVTGMTRSRSRFVAVNEQRRPAIYDELRQRMAGRTTVYFKAIVGGTLAHPSVRIVDEVDGW